LKGQGSRIDDLSPERRALLEQELLKRRVAARDAALATLPRRQADQPMPLSFPQQQLWFLDQLEPSSSAYNASLNMRLEGGLDVGALRRAFDEIVDRHETLRTVVDDEEGVPTARLLDHLGATIIEVDLASEGSAASHEDIEAAVRELVQQPFDLSADVMLRVGIITIGPTDHVLCMTMHHIACDGVSRGVLFDEVSALYNAFVSDRPSPLAPLPVQYADYAAWQQGWLKGEGLDAELEFWRDELRGADLVADLPLDHERTMTPSSKGGRVPFVVPASVAHGLRGLGREERATLYMVLHAATGVFLHGLSGQDDLIVGSPVANRRWAETDALIGFFVNTLVIRARMTGDPTFRELLRRSRETAIRCYGHQELPFDLVVQALRPRRHPNRNPLFQCNLRVQTATPAPPVMKGVRCRHISVGLNSSRFDVALGFADEAGDLHGYLEYNAALFDPETATAWIDGLLQMLAMGATDPDMHISAAAAPLAGRS